MPPRCIYEDQMDGAGPLDVFQSSIIANNQVTQRSNIIPADGLPNPWVIDVANPKTHFPKGQQARMVLSILSTYTQISSQKTRKYKIVLTWTGNVYKKWFA